MASQLTKQMASPTSNQYVVPSKGSVYLGCRRLPEGFPSMARTWGMVGINTLADVDPVMDPGVNPNFPFEAPWIGSNGHASVVSAWSGAAWDEVNRRLLITGGGHADYAGNEVYEWSAITGLFKRLNNPTGAIGNTGLLNDGLDSNNPSYFDGRPRSAHTYNHLIYTDGVLWNFQGSTYSGGAGKRGAYRFYNNDWQRNGTTSFGGNYGATIYDKLRSRFITLSPGIGRPGWYDPITDTTGVFNHWSNNNDTTGSELQCVYLENRDIAVSFTNNIQILKLDDTADSSTAVVTGVTPPWSNNRLIGAVYDDQNDRIMCWHGGSSIFVLKPPSGDFLTNAWTWSEIPAADLNVVPTAPASNGTYGRFWYSRSLNCCGVVNSTSQKMYVFRLG